MEHGPGPPGKPDFGFLGWSALGCVPIFLGFFRSPDLGCSPCLRASA